MPVLFEPAAPAGTAASASAGAAEQFARDLGPLAGLYAQGAHLQQQGQLAGLAATQHSNEAATQAMLADRGQQMQRQHYGDQTALGYATLQQHSADIDRQAQARAWLNQQDLSQAESLRLQKMQQAVGHVMADETLGKDDQADLVLQLRTGIDPLKQRLEASQARLKMQQAQNLFEQGKNIGMMNNADEAVRTKAFESRVVRRTNPETGEQGEFYVDHQGNLQAIPWDKTAGKAVATERAQAEKERVAQVKEDFAEEKEWQKEYRDTFKHFQQMARDKATGKAKGLDPHPEWSGTHLVENTEETMRQMTGYGNIKEFQAAQKARRATQGVAGIAAPAPAGQPAPPGTTPPQGQPSAAPTPEQVQQQNEQTVKENPPVTDVEKATPMQRAFLDRAARATAALDTIRLPGTENADAKRAIGEAEAAIKKYGSFHAMPKAEQEHFAAVRDMAARLDEQMGQAEAARQKFIAGQGNRLERGFGAVRDALNVAPPLGS